MVVRRVARPAVRAAMRTGRTVATDPARAAARIRVDPQWRRIEDGYAARLGPHETISVQRPVGHWRRVDPTRPASMKRLAFKAAGLGLWASAVAVTWWIGSSRRRGPLASVADVGRIGETVGEAVKGFSETP